MINVTELTPTSQDEEFTHVSISPDGHLVAAVTDTFMVYIWRDCILTNVSNLKAFEPTGESMVMVVPAEKPISSEFFLYIPTTQVLNDGTLLVCLKSIVGLLACIFKNNGFHGFHSLYSSFYIPYRFEGTITAKLINDELVLFDGSDRFKIDINTKTTQLLMGIRTATYGSWSISSSGSKMVYFTSQDLTVVRIDDQASRYDSVSAPIRNFRCSPQFSLDEKHLVVGTETSVSIVNASTLEIVQLCLPKTLEMPHTNSNWHTTQLISVVSNNKQAFFVTPSQVRTIDDELVFESICDIEDVSVCENGTMVMRCGRNKVVVLTV
mgnify:CR=1 FL=1